MNKEVNIEHSRTCPVINGNNFEICWIVVRMMNLTNLNKPNFRHYSVLERFAFIMVNDHGEQPT